jgi:hypothetical protein
LDAFAGDQVRLDARCVAAIVYGCAIHAVHGYGSIEALVAHAKSLEIQVFQGFIGASEKCAEFCFGAVGETRTRTAFATTPSR